MTDRAADGESELRELIIDIGKRIWTRGFVAANDGNISVRIGENEILTTATGVSKGFMTPEMIIRMTMDGKLTSPGNRYTPSSEVKMHIGIYKERPDVRSVIHAHPPYCTSFAVTGVPLDTCILPEAVIFLGKVPIAPYGTPSTVELVDSISEHIQNSDAVLLANHGALTVGIDLTMAYFRMETLEHTANILHLAMVRGNIKTLSDEQVGKLMEVRRKMNVLGRITVS
jgi:L-fuculose-phosphate aldolase